MSLLKQAPWTLVGLPVHLSPFYQWQWLCPALSPLVLHLKHLLTWVCNAAWESPSGSVSGKKWVIQGAQATGDNEEIKQMNSSSWAPHNILGAQFEVCCETKECRSRKWWCGCDFGLIVGFSSENLAFTLPMWCNFYSMEQHLLLCWVPAPMHSVLYTLPYFGFTSAYAKVSIFSWPLGSILCCSQILTLPGLWPAVPHGPCSQWQSPHSSPSSPPISGYSSACPCLVQDLNPSPTHFKNHLMAPALLHFPPKPCQRG